MRPYKIYAPVSHGWWSGHRAREQVADLATVAPLPLPAALRRTSVCTNTNKVLPGATQTGEGDSKQEAQSSNQFYSKIFTIK